jgi:hypothetical protein
MWSFGEPMTEIAISEFKAKCLALLAIATS